MINLSSNKMRQQIRVQKWTLSMSQVLQEHHGPKKKLNQLGLFVSGSKFKIICWVYAKVAFIQINWTI